MAFANIALRKISPVISEEISVNNSLCIIFAAIIVFDVIMG